MRRKPIKRKRGGRKSPIRISKLKKDLEALLKAEVIKKWGTDCYTCPQKNLQGANAQLSHVPWPRPILSVQCRYSHEFVRLACFRCNIHLGGNAAIAMRRMMREGIDVDALWEYNEQCKEREKTHKCGIEWFQDRISEYNAL